MDVEAFRRKLKKRAEENRIIFEGQYKDEINGLLGLSKAEIDSVTPDTTDLEVYDQLISVVKEASAANISQSELKDRIMELGKVAVSISKLVPKLAGLFI